MIHDDEDALICDLAEVYHIYDYRLLPMHLVATFSCGLRDNSRIMMKMNEQKINIETALSARILDCLNWLVWSKTKDAESGKNVPESIYNLLVGIEKEEKEKDYMVFESAEEFEAARNRRRE